MDNKLFDLIIGKDSNMPVEQTAIIQEAISLFEKATIILKQSEDAMGIKNVAHKSIVGSTIDVKLKSNYRTTYEI